MRERWTRLALGILLAVAVSVIAIRLLGNSPDENDSPSSALPASVPDVSASPTAAPTPVRDAQTGELIPRVELGVPFRMARSNLGSRLGVSPFSVHLADVERTVWPDTSLGNAEEGRFYPEKDVPGFKMILETDVDEGRYLYHTSMTRVVFVGQEESG